MSVHSFPHHCLLGKMLLGAAVALVGVTAALAQHALTTDPDKVILMPNMPRPGYLVPYIDPRFNTTITHITGNEGETYTDSEGQHAWGQYSRHHYSTVQPWNSDGSLIEVQVSGGPSVVYLDGDTYEPKYGKCTRPDNYDYYDTRWNPAPGHENEQINVSHGYLYWFNVVTCTEIKTIQLQSSDMTYIGGGGTVSSDGRYVVLADRMRKEAPPKIYVLDMLGTASDGSPGRFGPALDLPTDDCLDEDIGCKLDWVGLAASGKYVLVHYQNDYNRVYNVDLDKLTLSARAMPVDSPSCPSRTDAGDGVSNDTKDPTEAYIFDTGHVALTIDPADGEDVLVGQRRSWCTQANGVTLGHVVMVRLKDNKVTSLTNPTNEEYSYHVSARNTKLPGWVFVGYHNPADGRPWQRFTDEIVAISLASRPDRQIVRRLAHIHSTGNPYDNEAHAVPSPDGTRVIFASAWDWGCDHNSEGCADPRSDGNAVQDYVIDLRLLLMPACRGDIDDAIFCDGFDGPRIRLPPVGRLPDYQLGGAYTPDSDVAIVGRDRADPPAPGRYSICYINGFQTQPGELGSWPTHLILHSGGAPVMDPDWPEEAVLDTSSVSKRAQILTIIQPWIENCANDGFDAVEFDNLDSYTRSQGLITLQDNIAMAQQLVTESHRLGLAAAQKNTAEQSAVLHDQAGFDFALSEECAAYQECERYTDQYGSRVIDIEYSDNLPQSFQALCQQTPNLPSMVLRDRDLVPRGEPGYVFEACEASQYESAD